jgi:hypothetical protein
LDLLEKICTIFGDASDSAVQVSRRSILIGMVAPLFATNALASSLSEREEISMYQAGRLGALWEHYNEVIEKHKTSSPKLGRQHLKRSLVRSLFIYPETTMTSAMDLNGQLKYALKDIKQGEEMVGEYERNDLNGSLVSLAYVVLLNKVGHVCNTYDESNRDFKLSPKVYEAITEFSYQDGDENHLTTFYDKALTEFKIAQNAFVKRFTNILPEISAFYLPVHIDTERIKQ